MGRKGLGVEKRPNSIRLHFVYNGAARAETLRVNGKPLKPTPANLKFAERTAVEIRDKIKAGTFSLAEYFPASGEGYSPLTVGAQLDTWLAAQRITTSTKAGYESAARFWKAAPADEHDTPLGTLALRGVKLSHVLTALASKAALSGKTINNYVSVLREALQLAVHDKVLADNPAEHVPRAKWQRDPPDPFDRDEAEAIIADMRTHYPEAVYNLCEWWFFSGPRTSEVFGLPWSNVDTASGRTKIAEALVRGERKGTKTDTVREVLHNSRALAALKRQAAHTRMLGGPVWLDPRYGEPWNDERAFRRSYWEPTLKRLGIRYRRPYNMRHTFATLMLMAGMTPAWCAQQLGHSVEVFLRTYAKWLNGAQDALELQRLEAAINAPAARGRVTSADR